MSALFSKQHDFRRLSKNILPSQHVPLSPDELYESIKQVMAQNFGWIAAGRHPISMITIKDHPDVIPHMIIVGWSRQMPDLIAEETVYYRESRNGNMSTWTKSFRETWYPVKYNAQFQ